jgi:hypothetical protein
MTKIDGRVALNEPALLEFVAAVRAGKLRRQSEQTGVSNGLARLPSSG